MRRKSIESKSKGAPIWRLLLLVETKLLVSYAIVRQIETVKTEGRAKRMRNLLLVLQQEVFFLLKVFCPDFLLAG